MRNYFLSVLSYSYRWLAGDPKKGFKHCPKLEKINPFSVEESVSWHVSSEESTRVVQTASKLSFCFVISKMIPGHLRSFRENEAGIIQITSGFYSFEPFIFYL